VREDRESPAHASWRECLYTGSPDYAPKAIAALVKGDDGPVKSEPQGLTNEPPQWEPVHHQNHVLPAWSRKLIPEKTTSHDRKHPKWRRTMRNQKRVSLMDHS
jgi:hypothetical protein